MSLSVFWRSPRPLPRITWVANAARLPSARWRLGLFGFFERARGFPDSGLAVSVRGLLAWLGLATVAGYVVAAGSLTWWFRRQPHNRVGFAQVLAWPWRPEAVRRLRGEMWLQQAEDAWRAGRANEWYFLIGRGLAACPENFEARARLAKFLVTVGQRPQALQVLAAAAGQGLPSQAWSEEVFGLFESGEDWGQALRLADAFLARSTGAESWAIRQHLLAHKIVALRGLGRAGDALAVAEAEGDAAVLPVKLERARTLLALGRAAEAAQLTQRWAQSSARAETPGLLRLQAQAWREAGRIGEMERTLAELLRLQGPRPETRVFVIEQRVRAGQDAAAEIAEFALRFGASADALLKLAVVLAEVPEPAALPPVVTAARERGFGVRAIEMQQWHALLRAGRLAELPALLAEIEATPATPGGGDDREWLAWARALAGALQSPAPGVQSQLTALVQERAHSLPALRMTLQALRRAGREDTALAVVARARVLYPESPWLRREEEELREQRAARATRSMVPAGPAESERAGVEVVEAEFFLTLDRLGAERRWREAAEAIRRLRAARPAPGWLAWRERELLRREIRIDQAAGDSAAMLLAVSRLLASEPARADEVIAFAGELRAAGSPEDALLLARAVLEKSPGHAGATALWKALRTE